MTKKSILNSFQNLKKIAQTSQILVLIDSKISLDESFYVNNLLKQDADMKEEIKYLKTLSNSVILLFQVQKHTRIKDPKVERQKTDE